MTARAAMMGLAIIAHACSISTRAYAATAPTLATLFPAGAARGETVEITAFGSFDHWPAGIWFSGNGISASPLQEKGKFRVTVAADAIPGTRWVRLFDSEGATSLRPFVVGTIPEISEVEPNDALNSHQIITKLPVLVNGRLGKRGDVDGFWITLRQGQTLVADVEASRILGSPLNGVLQVANQAGMVLDRSDGDSIRDPRLIFVAPADGFYLVSLLASSATAGGDSPVYRLTLTTGGFLDYAFPFTVGRDCACRVEAIGSNITDLERLIPLSEPEREGEPIVVFHKALAGVSQTRRVTISVAEEAEPNDRTQPQSVPFPVSLSGRIGTPGDRDCYRVHLNKGTAVNVRLDSHQFGLPLDAVGQVFDPAGNKVLDVAESGVENDTCGRFSAQLEGEYLVEVRDLHGQGGIRYAYLLTIDSPAPSFELSVAADRIDVKPGESVSVMVAVDRKEGESRDILIGAESLADGASCKGAISRSGTDTANAVTLNLKVNDRARPSSFRIVGKTEGQGGQIHVARAPVIGFRAKTDSLWLNIRPSELNLKATPKTK